MAGVDKVNIKVYFETYDDKNKVYQNFRLVASNPAILKYFTNDKYLGYDVLSNEMSKYYAGDGVNIVYEEKKYFKNLITVKYDKLKNVDFDENLKVGQFNIATKIPMIEGCICCEHYRKKNKKCMYYQQVGIETKKYCKDFRQKKK
jgi:hypothetical protein